MAPTCCSLYSDSYVQQCVLMREKQVWQRAAAHRQLQMMYHVTT